MFFLRVKVLPLLAIAVLFAGIACGQTISTDQPNGLSLTVQPGQTATTVLNVTATAALTFNASVVTYSGGNWLTVSPDSNVPTPYPLLVGVDATRLSTGVYTGAIQIVQTTNRNNLISVGVTLSVGSPAQGNPTLLVSPATLSFTAQAGGIVPTPQTLNVTSPNAGMTFAASASTTDAYNWLQVSTLNTFVPAVLTVSANTAGMPAGNYTGKILLTPLTGPVVNVPVSLSVTGLGTTISANVSSLQFYYQIGSFLPSAQTFTVTGSGNASVPINLTAITTDLNNWLTVTPANASTPQTIVVTVSVYQLLQGSYQGRIHVSAPTTATGALDVPVTLTISTNALLTVGATPSDFVYQTGLAAPPAQTVPIAVTSGTLNYSVTTSTSDGSKWLAVSPLSGQLTQAAQNLTIAVNPVSLATGNYTGNVTISAPGAANSPVTIPIRLSVNGASTLTVSPQSVVVNVQTGVPAGQLFSQPLYVDSTGGSVVFTVSAVPTSCGANWLSAYPAIANTPASITVSTSPTGLVAPQTCTGTVVVTQAGSQTPIQVPLVLNLSTTPLFNVTPLALNFSAPFGGDPTGAKTLSLSVTDGSSLAFTALPSVTLGGVWLYVNPTGGTTPATLSATASPGSLSVGTYSGSITINSNALTKAVVIPVTFKVTATATAVATPASLSFTQVVGGTAPTSQNVTLTSTSGTLAFGAATSTNDNTGWLTLNQYEGTTPATVAVNANGRNLPAGVYTGHISVSVPGATNNPLIIPVTLTMTPSIAVDRSSLTFSYQQGGTAPQAQTINVTSAGSAVNVTAAVATGSNWLGVSPPSGTTPVGFSVSVSPGSLAVGGYDGTITLTPAGGTAVTVSVHLDVTAPPVLVTSIAAVSNGASGVRGPVSPGEIVIITGDALGPANGAGLVLDSNGKVSTTVAGTQVFFDEFAAPILYTSTHQVNAIVPYEVSGRGTVQVAAVYQGTRSANYTMQSAATAPGIFTATQSGRGQAAVLNEDNSYNGRAGPSVPAARGSIVQVFATGEGLTNPPNTTGSVTPDASYVPVAAVTAVIGSAPAEVTYKGSAPGAVAGLFQINVRIPQSAPTGDVSIAISVGGVMSQSGVTVAVK